jgi:hypothetical protein
MSGDLGRLGGGAGDRSPKYDPRDRAYIIFYPPQNGRPGGLSLLKILTMGGGGIES